MARGPWSLAQWHGPEVLAQLVPDETDGEALVRDAPRVPLTLYDIAVPVPDGWEPELRGYLQLSPAYSVMAQEARDRGWRTARHEGRHLDLLAKTDEVVEYVAELLGT